MTDVEATAADIAQRNKRLVIGHFEDFVNGRDLGAIERYMSPDFLDHDGPAGKPTGRDGDRAMMQAMHALMPDLRVEVIDAVAEGDKVVVRNRWTATNSRTGAKIEFHGFVMWRDADARTRRAGSGLVAGRNADARRRHRRRTGRRRPRHRAAAVGP
jgi:predicted ester cyclase